MNLTDFPELVAQWHPTKNGGLRPKDVTHGSMRVVWWQCQKGHEWPSNVWNRAGLGRGCPVCGEMEQSDVRF